MRKFIVGCFLALLFSVSLQRRLSLLPRALAMKAIQATAGSLAIRSVFANCEAPHCPVIDGQVSLSGENGGIEVIGEERRDIALEARVIVQDASREKAESIEREIKIVTTGTIHAEGPHMWGLSHGGWSVNYRLRVPRRVAAQLHTQNGGIELTNVDGVINADTTNGGLILDDSWRRRPRHHRKWRLACKARRDSVAG